jgi:antitoxin ParD1/3/4
MAMNISLPLELERRVDERVESGLYTSASELIREALRLFFLFDETRKHEIQALNQRIAEGLAQLDRGEGIPSDVARRKTMERRAHRVRTEG